MTQIRRLVRTDVDAVVRICNEAIVRGESTQGPDAVDAERILSWLFGGEERFEAYASLNEAGDVIAWGALTPHTGRSIYNISGELEIFVSVAHRRRGVGRALMARLLERARALGFHALLLLLQPEPTPPVVWAVRLGFRIIGSLSDALPVNGEWRDLLLFETFLSPNEASNVPQG